MTKQDRINQSLAKMKILDYLVMADDPSRQGIFNINKLARKYGIKAWLQEHEPGYFIPDQEMAGYMEK